MKRSNSTIVKILYVCVALFALAALCLQVEASAGKLPGAVPAVLPPVVSLAALVFALVVLLWRLWVLNRLLAPHSSSALFPDNSFQEVFQMHEAEKERAARISGLSHELRTPLTSINGFSELLMQDKTVTGEAREFATLIHAEAQRLTALVNTVLNEAELDNEPLTGGKP